MGTQGRSRIEPAVIADLRSRARSLEMLREDVVREGAATYGRWRPLLRSRAYRISALNLGAYLALRKRDLRDLQTGLMPYGLSSLGRCEARVVANLDAVLTSLRVLCGDEPNKRYPTSGRFFRGERLLQRNTATLFGPLHGHRHVRIMVTLPAEAAIDFDLVRSLIAAGMDCARINCAHDDSRAWEAMIDNVRSASREIGRHCTISADLAGPKMRTHEVKLIEGRERLFLGDRIVLAAQPLVQTVAGAHVVRCSLPEIVPQLRAGDSVWFDEGRIECIIDSVQADAAWLTVRRARAKGEKLKPQKGMNFPNSNLAIGPLTEDDRSTIAALADKVDMFGYSFVGTPSDVALLQQQLAAHRTVRDPCGIVLKIETARAVKHLPELIVQSAGSNPTAVMIARGDLAVEIGYRRLAEMQEELLWMCEAAHVPVVWATQVLDRFVRSGRPSRAEFTDAAMAERADCVMLNKGPYVVEAVEVLSDLLGRMEAHQTKKTSRLRRLGTW